MNAEQIFRSIFILMTIALTTIRVYYQKKVLPERKRESIKGNHLALIPGAIAAVTTIIFGLEYIIAPGSFHFAYQVTFPTGLRSLGLVMLSVGILLLWSAHHHLGRSFSSFVAFKENQSFVDTGPYRYIRHPIYTAYILNYLGGGFLAANIILTIVPVVCFCVMIAFRVPEEEEMLIKEYGERYKNYITRTGRFLPLK